MSRPLIHWSIAVILLGFAGSPLAASTPFSLTPTFDVEIGNDSQIGPTNSSATGSGMGIRNVATRRRVSYATYDLTGLRGSGQVFLNVSLSNYGHDPGTVNVYGVLESVEHLGRPGNQLEQRAGRQERSDAGPRYGRGARPEGPSPASF